MRVLIAHNYYQLAGGEDIVVDNEKNLLAQHGHAVRLCTVSNDDIVGVWSKLKTAWSTPYAQSGRDWLRGYIREFHPDIVHVHNFFPLLTPAIYDACREAGVPVVQTLHNYRTVCAGAYLMRDGRPCEDCVGRSPYQAVLHKCYRESRLGSLAVARMIDFHRRHGTWREKVDRFIALTEFAKSRFVAAGFPAAKICVKPNFVTDPGAPENHSDADRKGALFVGRLSAEKGVGTLLEAWESVDVPLVIAGNGPLAAVVQRAAGSGGIQWLGQLPPENVAKAMHSSGFLVIPSQCYEGFPMVLVEAFACGFPVIASRLGSLAEIVEDGVTGLQFTPGDAADLAAKVRWAAEHPSAMRDMGRRARRVYEERYTAGANYQRLMAIYETANAERTTLWMSTLG